MRLPHGTWVVIADGRKYKILENIGDEVRMNLHIWGHAEQENPATREQGTDKPGRFNDAGMGRSAVADTDWHEFEETRFAHELAEKLRTLAIQNKFQRLVIVADPRTLGDIRSKLHPEVTSRLMAEIDKDLTNHPTHEIENRLADEAGPDLTQTRAAGG